MTDLQQHGQELLAEALAQLGEAMLELTRPTSPQTPLPRPPAKPVRLARSLEIRMRVNRSVVVYFFANGVCFESWEVSADSSYGGGASAASRVARTMIPHLSHPRALAHCLRQLRWLTAWMRKRAEGRRRAAEEILRQQRKWVEMLEGEIALRKLAE